MSGRTFRGTAAIALALCRLAASAAGAADALTWEDCIRLAKEHNPALAAARQRIQAAQAAVAGSRSTQLPQFSTSARAARSENNGADTDSGGQSYNATLNVGQSLYSGGRNSAAIQGATYGLRITEQDADNLDAEVTWSLRGAFVNMLYAQQEQELLRKIGARRAENLELVKMRYNGGREHEGSMALSQAALYEALTDATQAVRRVALTRTLLSRAIGLGDEAGDWLVAGNLEAAAPIPQADLRAPADAVPSVGRAIAARENAESQVDVARSAFLPDVDLVGSAGRYGDEQAFDDDRWSLGLQLSFPFWPGGGNAHDYRKARANLKEAEAFVESARNAAVADLAEAQEEFRAAVENVVVQEKYLRASELRAKIARKQYENGILSFENWDIIENDLISKRKLLLNAQQKAVLAEAAWWKANGKGALQ